MQTKLSVRHGQLNEDVQKIIIEKSNKLLTFFNRLTMIEVTVDLQDPLRRKVEIKANAEHKHEGLIAHAEDHDLLHAFDMCLKKMEMQLRHYKEKIQEHRREQSVGEASANYLRDESRPA
jgi:putative sigma-54 modulation protein